jgi:uncharacterized protein YkwD
VRRISLLIAVAATLAPASAAEARACRNADAHPSSITVRQARAATVCLLNVERRKRGLRPLRQNAGLALAGQRHVADMVRRRYFAHASLLGTTFDVRIRRTGYLRGTAHASLGENLAWGGGRRATARRIVRSWMQSPGHRANVLQPKFREVGIGVIRKLPVAAAGRGATYAAEFGARYSR